MTTKAMAMPASSKFWDRHAEKYAEKPIEDEAAYQKKLRITRDHLRPDMQVLEFGCGTGSTAIVHAPYVKHILATDISSKMLEIAEQKAREQQVSNVSFQQATVEDFQAENESFDAILGLSLLHLLENKEAAIAKFRRLLKPGGVFVSNTVCLGDAMGYFKFIAPVGRMLGVFPILRVFKMEELLDSLKAGGFDIDYEWRPNNRVLFVVARKPEYSLAGT